MPPRPGITLFCNPTDKGEIPTANEVELRLSQNTAKLIKYCKINHSIFIGRDPLQTLSPHQFQSNDRVVSIIPSEKDICPQALSRCLGRIYFEPRDYAWTQAALRIESLSNTNIIYVADESSNRRIPQELKMLVNSSHKALQEIKAFWNQFGDYPTFYIPIKDEKKREQTIIIEHAGDCDQDKEGYQMFTIKIQYVHGNRVRDLGGNIRE